MSRIDKINIIEAITNDGYLAEMYKYREKVISHINPKILLCKNTNEYRYIIESELLKKIDRLIQLRIDQLKKAYEI